MEGDKKLILLPTLESSEVATINLNDLISHNSQTRSIVVEKLRQACQEKGFFQITNHGKSKRVIEDALGWSGKFFDLPIEEKNVFSSEDVYRPVRYAALRSNNVLDGGVLSREFMKLFAYSIEDCVDRWPGKPADYRETLGKYATEVRRVYITVMGAIMESLGLTPNHLRESIEHRMQMLAINSYPQCFSSTNVVGISSHTDHSIITILVESTPGLDILVSRDRSWKLVPAAEKCSLIVLVGNHLKVISNGLYKSAVHKWFGILKALCSPPTTQSPLYYLAKFKRDGSSVAAVLGSRPSKKRGQTTIFDVRNLEKELTITSSLALLCVEEVETKHGHDHKTDSGYFSLFVNKPDNVKVEKCSKHGIVDDKAKLSLEKMGVTRSSWDELGANEVEFREGNKPVHVSFWIGSGDDQIVMAISTSEKCVYGGKIVVTVPNAKQV